MLAPMTQMTPSGTTIAPPTCATPSGAKLQATATTTHSIRISHTPRVKRNAPRDAGDLLALIRRIRDELAITIVLVAHDIPLVMGLCDRIQVLNYGQLIADGPASVVRNDPAVIGAYLGQARER